MTRRSGLSTSAVARDHSYFAVEATLAPAARASQASRPSIARDAISRRRRAAASSRVEVT